MLHFVPLLSEIVLRGRVGEGSLTLQMLEPASPIAAVPLPAFLLLGAFMVSGLSAVFLEYQAERRH